MDLFGNRPAIRLFAAVALVVLTGVVIAACGGSSSDSTSGGSTEASGESKEASGGGETAQVDCPVKVLSVANFTGEGSQNGATVKGGAEAAMAQIEKEGGVLGCPIELVTKDNGSDYTKSLPLMQAAISEEDYANVNAPDFGCASVLPLVNKKELLSITDCSVQGTANPKYNPFTFETAYTGGGIDAAAGKYMVEEKGYKKIALITDNTAYGTSAKENLESAASEAGGEVVDTEQVGLEEVNFSSAIQRAEASHPDALMVDLYGAAMGHFMNDLETSGWKVPTVSGFSGTATNLEQLGVPKAQAEGLETAGVTSMGLPLNERSAELVKQLKADGAKIEGSLAQYAQNHDWMTLFAWAANETGSLEPEAITNFLAENGETPVPHLVMGETTGYTPECHEFAAPEGLAMLQGGYFEQGGLPLVAPLKIAVTECPKPLGS